jgi:hypothetical protein
VLVIASARAVVILWRGRIVDPRGWLQALIVAATYEAGRALSLVSGATHKTRVRVRHA